MASKAKGSKRGQPAENSSAPLEGMSMEELFAAQTPEEMHTTKLVGIAQKQLKTSMDYKRDRMAEVQKSIDLYHGKTKKALKGRWNLPLPLMSGYVDTLLSKIDDPPKVKYGYQDVADLRRAKKVQAKWEQDSAATEGRWAEKDRLTKKLASFYGVGIMKYFAYNDSKGMYRTHLEVVDPIDFECEPMGGQNLSNHKFKGQRNIFKTKAELLAGATGKDAIYDKKQVLHLIATLNSSDYKTFSKVYQEKTDRLKALGFSPEQNSYMGVPIYNMTEWYMEDPETGENWYLFFEPETGIAIRSCPLAEVFESDKDPYEAWHTHVDPFNFWSKSPADDMRPVAEGMNIIFNQALDNREKKNYAQRAYDPAVFPDPSQLEWRPDGLVEVTEGISQAGAIGNGIYRFTIEDMPESGTIDLMTFMDNMTGLKTGISASAQGAADDKLVGIYYGNLQQVADRLGLFNKAYSECWGRLGLKYYWGLREHIQTNKLMVRMVGDGGYNWEELVAEDLDPVQEFNIEIVGGQAEAQHDEILKKTKNDALVALIANPTFASRLNPDVTIEEVLRNGGWEEAQIKRLQNQNGPESDEMISRAHQAIQDILVGKEPPMFRRANALFLQTITDWLWDASDISQEKWQAIFDFAQAHVETATYNGVVKARLAAAMSGAPLNGSGAPAAPGALPSPSPEGPMPGNTAVPVPGSPTTENLGFSEAALQPKDAIAMGRAPQA